MMCLYIAGTLFVIGTNGAAVPIGPNSHVVDNELSVTIRGGGAITEVDKEVTQGLAQWLTACDDQATKRIMEQEQW